MKKVIESKKVAPAVGPYCQAIETDNLIFVSVCLPIDGKTNEVADNIKNQTIQSLTNIKYILQEAGLDMSNIVKTTVLLKDMNDFGIMNEVYASFFEGDYPARICYEVARLPKDVLVEIDCIAIK